MTKEFNVKIVYPYPTEMALHIVRYLIGSTFGEYKLVDGFIQDDNVKGVLEGDNFDYVDTLEVVPHLCLNLVGDKNMLSFH